METNEIKTPVPEETIWEATDLCEIGGRQQEPSVKKEVTDYDETPPSRWVGIVLGTTIISFIVLGTRYAFFKGWIS